MLRSVVKVTVLGTAKERKCAVEVVLDYETKFYIYIGTYLYILYIWHYKSILSSSIEHFYI